MSHTWQHANYEISTDKARLDLDAICALLAASYWAADRPRDLIRRSIENSLVFGVYDGERQIGFARLVTDYATFAYLADVMIAEPYRGQGLGKWLVKSMLSHPEVQQIQHWLLITDDAHGLYRQFGFIGLDGSDRYMERMMKPQFSEEPPSSAGQS